MDIKKVSVRAGSGLIYIALVTGLICCGYPGVTLLVAIFTVLATIEFDHICRLPHERKPLLVVCDVILNLMLALSGGLQAMLLLPLFLLFLLARYVIELSMKNDEPLKSLATSLMSIVYIGVPMLCMNFLALAAAIKADNFQWSVNPEALIVPLWPILAIFILIWVNDTGAFLTGSLMGKHKLSPLISPKKTWEGFFGGMILTAIAAVVVGHFLFDCLQIGYCVVYGILVSIFATWGDLTESLIKRNLGLKDSGHIMPGHGGILDRIDSLLFVMPLTVLLLWAYNSSSVVDELKNIL